MRGITLTLEQQETFIPNITDGYRIRITATNPNGMNVNIFLYDQHPIDVDGKVRSECVGVCTVPDYESLPVGGPRENDTDKRFRLDYVDQVFRTRDIANDAWDAYRAEVERLVASLDAADSLTATTSVRIGT